MRGPPRNPASSRRSAAVAPGAHRPRAGTVVAIDPAARRTAAPPRPATRPTMPTAIRLSLVLAVLLPAVAARAEEPAPVLGPLEAALLFHDQAHTSAPEDRLVSWYGEVCGEQDRDARAAAARAAREPLRRLAHQAAFTERWRIPLRQTLGGYDLTREGFPTTLHTGAVIRFGAASYCGEPLTYLVAFENGDEHAMVHVPKARALDFVRQSPGREVVHELEVEVVRARPGPEPVLVVRIVRMRTLDARRQTLVADSR
jgi:hypothetical protein